MTNRLEMDRRTFIAATATVGGGMAIGLGVPAFGPGVANAQAAGVEIFNWIVVAPDSTVTIRIAQQEMGQGTITAMAQLLSEELELDWSKIKAEFIDVTKHLAQDKVYGNTVTAASWGVYRSQDLLRVAGATIRMMLISAAAIRLNVPASELVAENSTVIHRASGRKLTYGELAADASAARPPDPRTVTLKDPKDWKVIGKSVKRLDVPMKTDGSLVFGIDVKVPGMVHAAIMSSPVFGGKLKSFDANAITRMPGVRRIVEIKGGAAGFTPGMDDGIAVVADNWWQAKTALDALPKEWDGGANANANSDTYFNAFKAGLTAPPKQTLRNEGNVETALKSAAKTLEAEYYVPYIEHATLEPMNCTALVTDDRFEVWAPTQSPEAAIDTASKIVGLPIPKGRLNITFIGGGFGRRLRQDYVSQALQIAKAMKGTPVKLIVSREETTRHGFYRPSTLGKLRGGLDANGNLIAWSHRIVGHAEGEALATYGADQLLYSIPNMHVDFVHQPSHVPTGALRSVAFGQNTFATQSFKDELARAAGKDPYQFSRALLDPAKTLATVTRNGPKVVQERLTAQDRTLRLRNALDEVAKKSDWGKPLGPNRGRGLALEEETMSFFAVVAEVTLDGSGWFSLDRVVVAGDPGYLVNPYNATAQVEGAVAFGLNIASYGEITINNGRVVQGNFDDYQQLRISEMPKVEAHFPTSGGFWGGVGEPPVAAIMPALANAIYDAGGPRIRSLPLKNENLAKRA